MFYEFTTVKGEKFVLNVSRIEYFTETKKGTLIVSLPFKLLGKLFNSKK